MTSDFYDRVSIINNNCQVQQLVEMKQRGTTYSNNTFHIGPYDRYSMNTIVIPAFFSPIHLVKHLEYFTRARSSTSQIASSTRITIQSAETKTSRLLCLFACRPWIVGPQNRSRGRFFVASITLLTSGFLALLAAVPRCASLLRETAATSGASRHDTNIN